MFVLGGLVCATWLSAQDYQKTAYGIKAAAGGVDVEVQFFTPSVVRVVKSPQGEHFEKKSLAGRGRGQGRYQGWCHRDGHQSLASEP